MKNILILIDINLKNVSNCFTSKREDLQIHINGNDLFIYSENSGAKRVIHYVLKNDYL